MAAIWQGHYGGPEALQLATRPVPVPGGNEVLVRVHAAALEVADCFAMRGFPIVIRPMSGLWRPTPGIPGMGVAGRVVETGGSVTRFRPGDEVFGCCTGACATYAKASEAHLARKPSSVSWQQAAATTGSALAALHALRDTARLQPGQRLLVIGAAGGIGHFAVQLARHLGAEVTGVCSGGSVEAVRGLGAHHVIDYTREDFADTANRYHVILDNVESRPLADCRRVLTPDGMLLCNSGTGARGLAFAVRLLKPLLLNPFTRQRLRRYLSMPNAEDLTELGRLLEGGSLQPIIGEAFPLADTPAALRQLEAGHTRGKLVIEVAS
jgi:NADPH:quinone reductase-like Zn-dependent oxidoreductase